MIGLNEKYRSEMSIGNKARFLMELTGAGFQVPGGIVLDREDFESFLAENGLRDEIEGMLSQLDSGNIEEISASIHQRILSSKLPDALLGQIESSVEQTKKYAVRSSGAREDLESFSFAGMYETFLDCDGIEAISDAIIKCYASAFSVNVLSYIHNHKINLDEFYLAVVIQEMIDADHSGVCFTVNPVTGIDKEMFIEVVEGAGENLVSGHVAPEEYFYNWYEDALRHDENAHFISDEMGRSMGKVFLSIQKYLGYPCDIEFSIKDGKLYILQARRITKINYSAYSDIWTSANYKDGGVSSTVCTPLMWSLYEYSWGISLRDYTVESKLIFEDDLRDRKLSNLYFGRPYWNLSYAKLAMSRVVGYKEREFDYEYGVQINYDGDGQTTELTPKTLISIIRMAIAQKALLKKWNDNVERYRQELLDIYSMRKRSYDEGSIGDIKKAWYSLTRDEYLKSETIYFRQVFINTVHQALYKNSLLKYVSENDYLMMLGGIDNISHLLPYYEIWKISRAIRADKDSYEHWNTSNAEQLAFEVPSDDYYMPEVRGLLSKYGYHSDKELDVTTPSYSEDPRHYLIHIKEMILMDDSRNPENDRIKGREQYEKIMSDIKAKSSLFSFRKIRAKVEKIRRMLWWREEFKDISTRFYHLIHIYTVKLGKLLEEEGVLNRWEDIWFIKIEMLWDYLDGKIEPKVLYESIARDHDYYDSFRNYEIQSEIGSVFDGADRAVKKQNDGRVLKGLGANNGVVTGPARVIRDYSEIDSIQPGEILVTCYTNTGWAPKFAILKGIVTECGGILCHAAIVAREYGIPTVVVCPNATSVIKTGQQISVNGTTGEVTVLDGMGSK